MEATATGKINVQTENIFPIIKKFLYSDHEIFLRELVSNAVDATQKLRILANKGEFKGDVGEVNIEIKIDKEAKTLTITDKGIGMTEAEVNKYINEVAFSSAEDFLKKHKSDAATIIGHFGLGFYSAFMAADTVEINTKSYKKGKAVKWSCDGSPEYTISPSDRKERGTEITLHISEDSVEFLETARIKGILDKHCKFLPVDIKFDDKVINNTHPAWTKTPSDLKDEDYTDFYKELYPFSDTPLFWIHLNVDYPFNLTGILYFPKLGNTIEVQKNKIQLYCNQVFVTDEVKEIVPEFLTLLHGVIDSPDIPLNVSRSYLQSDPNVKKINSYVTKKVADKLEEMFKNERGSFEEKWDNISVFVKYGMISEDKFYDKAQNFCLYKDTDDKYYTLEEYKAATKDLQTDKNEKLICLYTSNVIDQDAFIQSATNRSYKVVKMDNVIDTHFISTAEQKNTDLSFVRVDAETIDKLIDKDEVMASVLSEKEETAVKELFDKQIENPMVNVELKSMNPEDQAVMITKPEFTRRMKEMAELSGGMNMMMGGMGENYNVVVNANHPFVSKLLTVRKAEKKEKMVKHLYDLARLSQNMLKGKELTEFIARSVEIVD